MFGKISGLINDAHGHGVKRQFGAEAVRLISIVIGLAISAAASANISSLPPEVAAFIKDRDVCDHFRGEPFEGDSPEQIERREFILGSLEIYCPGTDRRLAALKNRYKNNSEVMKRLNGYEVKAEGTPCP